MDMSPHTKLNKSAKIISIYCIVMMIQSSIFRFNKITLIVLQYCYPTLKYLLELVLLCKGNTFRLENFITSSKDS